MTKAQILVCIRRLGRLTQKEAAELCDVSHRTFTRYEAGDTIPPWPVVLFLWAYVDHPSFREHVKIRMDDPEKWFMKYAA
jgi:transcriptional regulator with XRE-family HTH domain